MISMILMIFLAVFPTCQEEDGSTQPVCVWNDGTGAIVLNIDYGEFWITWE